MAIQDFYNRVKATLKRGGSLDELIPYWAEDAVRLLEQNYTFSWMWRRSVETFNASNAQMELALDANVKEIAWAKPINYDDGQGGITYGDALTGVDDVDLLSIDAGLPSGFWLEAADTGYVMKFDAVLQDTYKLHIKQAVYTDWAGFNPDTDTPVVLARAKSVLLFQTCIVAANELKDPTMADTYGGLLQGGLNTLLRSEEDLKMNHQQDLVMRYNGLS